MELAEVVDDHVPRWLPEGMGLVFAFGPGEDSFGGAYFADIGCREIELWFWDSTDIGSGEHVDGWMVSESGPHDCGNDVLGTARCIDYAHVVDGGQIGVQMMGISRGEGDRIVRSIPT